MQIASKNRAIVFAGGSMVFAGMAVSHFMPYAGWKQNPFGTLLLCVGFFVAWLGIRNGATRHMAKAMGGLVLLLVGGNLSKLTPDDGWWLYINLLAALVWIGVCIGTLREFARLRSEASQKRI